MSQTYNGKSWQDFREHYGTLPGTGSGPNPGAGKDAKQYYGDYWKNGEKSTGREGIDAAAAKNSKGGSESAGAGGSTTSTAPPPAPPADKSASDATISQIAEKAKQIDAG